MERYVTLNHYYNCDNCTLLSQRKYAAFIRKGGNGIAEFLGDREECTMNIRRSHYVFRATNEVRSNQSGYQGAPSIEGLDFSNC